MTVSRPHPAAHVAATTRRSSTNTQQSEGAAQRNVAMSTPLAKRTYQFALQARVTGPNGSKLGALAPATFHTGTPAANAPQRAGAPRWELAMSTPVRTAWRQHAPCRQPASPPSFHNTNPAANDATRS
jgi:hypothetical protein